MTRRMEDFVRRLLYVCTTLLMLGAIAMGVYMGMHRPESLSVEWKEPIAPAHKTSDAADLGTDPMISKLAASHMSKAVIQSEPVRVKLPVPNLSVLLRVKGIMDFGDPKSSEAIIESMRASSTKNYKVDDLVDCVEAKVLKIDKQVAFLYDGKEIQLGVNAEVGVELPVAGSENEPALSDNRLRVQRP